MPYIRNIQSRFPLAVASPIKAWPSGNTSLAAAEVSKSSLPDYNALHCVPAQAGTWPKAIQPRSSLRRNCRRSHRREIYFGGTAQFIAAGTTRNKLWRERVAAESMQERRTGLLWNITINWGERTLFGTMQTIPAETIASIAAGMNIGDKNY